MEANYLNKFFTGLEPQRHRLAVRLYLQFMRLRFSCIGPLRGRWPFFTFSSSDDEDLLRLVILAPKMDPNRSGGITVRFGATLGVKW